MRYNFSSQFLKLTGTDSNFGEAWEALCHDLLAAELGDKAIMRLGPPDCGVDILSRVKGTAYQCKSSERGASGSIPGAESVKSLETAVENRSGFSWQKYVFATNADYTGNGYIKVIQKVKELGLSDSEIDFLGPKYWNDLCEKHYDHVSHRLDFRLSYTEEEVVEAFQKAGFYDKYIEQYRGAVENSQLNLIVRNNRTPLKLEIPFSPELTVKNCIDAARVLLGVSLVRINYDDLGTSAAPSLSIAIDQKSQDFSKRIGDLEFDAQDGLQFWITISWKDNKPNMVKDSDVIYYSDGRIHPAPESTLSYAQRKKQTIDRTEESLQAMMWEAVATLQKPA